MKGFSTPIRKHCFFQSRKCHALLNEPHQSGRVRQSTCRCTKGLLAVSLLSVCVCLCVGERVCVRHSRDAGCLVFNPFLTSQ